MTRYNTRTVVKTAHANTKEFKVKVGAHQELVLRPLLFVAVTEAMTYDATEGLLREILYADDLVLLFNRMCDLI